MKKRIGLYLFLNTLLIIKAHSFILSGTLPQVADETVRLQFYASPFQTEINEEPFKVDKDGSFKIKIYMYEGQVISFVSGKLLFRFYADPDDSLDVQPKVDKGVQMVYFSGNGAAQANYVFQKSLYFSKNFESPSYSHLLILEMTNRKAEDFKLYCDSVSAVKLKYLKQNKAKLSLAFYNWQQGEDIYESVNTKINYPIWYYSMRGIDNKQLTVDSTYYDFLKHMEINNDKYIYSTQYRNFLKYFLLQKYALKNQRPDALQAYNESEVYFKGKVLQTFRMHLWNEIVLYGHFSDASTLFPTLSKLYGNEKDFKLIEAKYNEKLPFSVGALAPGFELNDLNGNKISLESFKGKVVYLDFWASWCGPCMAELPSSEKLKKHFSDNDVVFINVSIDQNEDAWKKSVAKNQITGINLIGNSSSEIGKNYKVSSIPAYFLIDKNGKFISAPAQRPSREVIYQQIEDALK